MTLTVLCTCLNIERINSIGLFTDFQLKWKIHINYFVQLYCIFFFVFSDFQTKVPQILWKYILYFHNIICEITKQQLSYLYIVWTISYFIWNHVMGGGFFLHLSKVRIMNQIIWFLLYLPVLLTPHRSVCGPICVSNNSFNIFLNLIRISIYVSIIIYIYILVR